MTVPESETTMTIDDAARLRLYDQARTNWGSDAADTLMSLMPTDPDSFATRDDMAMLRSDLRGEMSELRGELRNEMTELRREMAVTSAETIRTIVFAMLATNATLVGLVFGTPAARIKGLYLAIATLAAQYILEDFFSRAAWFTGGAAGATAHPPGLAGFEIRGDTSYFYLVLVVGVLMFAFAANLMRTRAGRAMVAVRDHYLAAEIMGIALTRTRVLAFALASFYAGVAGALMGHYIGFVSTESINILLSVQMLGMIIIGGLGSIMGSLLGAAFMVLMPEAMESLFHALGSGGADKGLVYLKEISIGAVIILFLVFEPDGLAHRWRQVKAWWKLYPFSH